MVPPVGLHHSAIWGFTAVSGPYFLKTASNRCTFTKNLSKFGFDCFNMSCNIQYQDTLWHKHKYVWLVISESVFGQLTHNLRLIYNWGKTEMPPSGETRSPTVANNGGDLVTGISTRDLPSCNCVQSKLKMISQRWKSYIQPYTVDNYRTHRVDCASLNIAYECEILDRGCSVSKLDCNASLTCLCETHLWHKTFACSLYPCMLFSVAI